MICVANLFDCVGSFVEEHHAADCVGGLSPFESVWVHSILDSFSSVVSQVEN